MDLSNVVTEDLVKELCDRDGFTKVITSGYSEYKIRRLYVEGDKRWVESDYAIVFNGQF